MPAEVPPVTAPADVPLTVVVPTYNRAGYVRECLTALARSGVPGLEVIVADDGSTDDTAAVVREVDPTARYLWQPNTGTPATARNAGFAESRGRYVAFLDCDDAWLPGAPARAVALLDRHPEVDVLFAEAQVGNPQTGYHSWIEVAGQAVFRDLPGRELEPGFRALDRGPFFRRMAVRNQVFLGACVIRREAFAAIGGFDPKLRGAADWEVLMRLAHQFTYGFMAEPLAIYTQHPGSMATDQDGMTAEFCRALTAVLERCPLSPDDRRHVRDRLRHHLFNYAYLAYDQGRYADARPRFTRAVLAGNLRPHTLALWLSSRLPGPVVRRLRGAKHAISKSPA